MDESDEYQYFLEEERNRKLRLSRMTPIQRKNNPRAEPMGAYTGRCQGCGSNNLWSDVSMYGCNNCGAMYRN